MYKWHFYSPTHLRFTKRHITQTIIHTDHGKVVKYGFGDYSDGLHQEHGKIVVGEDYVL